MLSCLKETTLVFLKMQENCLPGSPLCHLPLGLLSGWVCCSAPSLVDEVASMHLFTLNMSRACTFVISKHWNRVKQVISCSQSSSQQSCEAMLLQSLMLRRGSHRTAGKEISWSGIVVWQHTPGSQQRTFSLLGFRKAETVWSPERRTLVKSSAAGWKTAAYRVRLIVKPSRRAPETA